MNYTQFKEEMTQRVGEIMGEEVNVKVHTVIKNNSVKLDGMSLFGKKQVISPTIYLNDFYENYLQGESLEEVANKIANMYAVYKIDQKEADINFFKNYDIASKRIVYKLINYEKNKELLQKVPYIKYMDLAVVFYYLVSSEKFENASIMVSNTHLEMWNVNIADITKAAVENTPELLECEIKNITEIIMESFDGFNEDEVLKMQYNQEVKMYIVTNMQRMNGAACMLYPDIIKNFADSINDDLYILPSSIHEIILIPKSTIGFPKSLKIMVNDVNTTQLSREEILSDSVYEFNRSEGKIKICL